MADNWERPPLRKVLSLTANEAIASKVICCYLESVIWMLFNRCSMSVVELSRVATKRRKLFELKIVLYVRFCKAFELPRVQATDIPLQ